MKQTVRFRRELRLWHALSLVVGSTVGTGIFLFVSPIAASLVDPWAILFAWLVGALISLCGAACIAELAACYPETGGTYVYLKRAFGPMSGFLYTWMSFLMMRVGSLAIPALAFTDFFADFCVLDALVAAEVRHLLAVSLICIFTLVNILGVKLGGEIQSLLTVLKVLCLFFVMGVGLLFGLGFFEPYPVAMAAKGLEAKASGSLVLAFLSALVPVLWTFGGWDEPTFVAEEIRKPERHLPIALIGGLSFVALLYLGVNAAYLAILSPQEIAATGGSTAIVAMKRALGQTTGRLVALFLMVATLGVINGMVMTGARIALAAGFDQMFFRWFTQTHQRSGTPQRALVVQALLAIVAILTLDNFYALLLYSAFPYWLFSAFVALAVIVLRRKDPKRKRPFKVWFYPLPVIVYFVASLAMLVATFTDNWKNASISLGMLVLGILMYFLQSLLRQFVTPSSPSQG